MPNIIFMKAWNESMVSFRIVELKTQGTLGKSEQASELTMW
jgi:hypothetical protein